MKQPKNRYNVYQLDRLDYGDGRRDERRTLAGTTWAVSEKQAVSQIKYRLGITARDLSCYWAGDGGRNTTFYAERA